MDPRKQERVLLRHADDNHYQVTSVTAVPSDAAALAEAGLVDVVVLVCHTRATLEMAGRVGLTKVTIDETHPDRKPITNHDRLRGQILDAARRGVAAEAIAAVLDVPVATVHEALGIDKARPVHQRTRQPGRRPRIILAGPPGHP